MKMKVGPRSSGEQKGRKGTEEQLSMNKSSNLDTVSKVQTTNADTRRRDLDGSVPSRATEFTPENTHSGFRSGWRHPGGHQTWRNPASPPNRQFTNWKRKYSQLMGELRTKKYILQPTKTQQAERRYGRQRGRGAMSGDGRRLDFGWWTWTPEIHTMRVTDVTPINSVKKLFHKKIQPTNVPH